MSKAVIVFTILVLSFTASAEEHAVVPPQVSHVYATGIFLAKPRKCSPRGIFIHTFEIHTMAGNFDDSTMFSGNGFDVSTKSESVCNQIQGANENANYIFTYWNAYPFHFNFQSTYVMVTGLTAAPPSADFASTKLPLQFDIERGRVGSYVTKESGASRTGRIVSVNRMNTYILGRPICYFVLDQGGSRDGGKQGSVPNTDGFEVQSEEGCRYVEAILPYGLDVRVLYSQAKMTIDPYDHFAYQIKIDRVPGISAAEKVELRKANKSLTDEILADPKFQEAVRALVDDYARRAKAQ